MKGISRRGFLGSAAAFAAFPALRASAASPNARVNLAFVGIGNRGADVFSMFAWYRDMINVVAFCDTQMGAPHTEKVLAALPDVPRYTDFRKMLEERGREIDAVVIATPDFSHFPIAMLAMSMGKAVFCEKPLANTFREIGLMTAAAKRHGVVTQMGNQGHSDGNFWQCRALVDRGWLTDVTRIDAWMSTDRRWHKWNGTLTEMPGGGTPPAGLDWDLWQCQRPARSFSNDYLYGDWRCFYEYGTGALGDWGAHLFDAAWECLELGLPTSIAVEKTEGATPVVYPMASTLRYAFPARGPGKPACELVWYDGQGNKPALPAAVTDKKYEQPPHGEFLHLADGRVLARGSHGETLRLIAGVDPKDPGVKAILRDYPRGKSGHYLNFLKAVRGEEKANSSFDKAGPLSQVLALGALAQRLPVGTYAFDPAKGVFADARANAMLADWPSRETWREYEKL